MNLFRLMQIEEEIAEDLGIPVTITTRNALHPLMKDRIERDAVRVI
jgi:predicted nucleotidyltransferase